MKKKHSTGLSVIFRASCGHATHIFVQTVLLALLPTVQTLAVAAVIDEVTALVQGGSGQLAWAVAGFFGCILYSWLGREAVNLSKVHLKAALQRYCEERLLEKRAKLQYLYIEDKQLLEKIERVSTQTEQQFLEGYENVLGLVSIAIQLMGIFALLIVWAWWVALAILVVCAPMFWLAIRSGKATYQANAKVTSLTKRANYLSHVLSSRETAEERTLFGYTHFLNEQYKQQYETALRMEVLTQAKWFVRLKAGSLIVVLISILIAAILVQPLMAGAITLGVYISLLNSSMHMVHLVSWQLMRNIDGLARNREFLREWCEVMDMEEEKEALSLPQRGVSFEMLEFRNVRFAYPGTEKFILKGVNMKLEKGLSYGFVGANGAGKTTLVKLLTGLYREYEGSILLNGRELRDMPIAELKGTFSAVYQDFARYEVSVKDNIALGNVQKQDEATLLQAAENMELTEVIQSLQKQWDTPLGRTEADGVDLSGGQWQRIAIARAMVNPAPVCIMDEPTAALDPMAESRVYEDLGKLRSNRTTFFISHRLGSMKLVDRIFVLRDGVIVESGSHAQLMERNGVYAEMYESQRRWYE